MESDFSMAYCHVVELSVGKKATPIFIALPADETMEEKSCFLVVEEKR